MFCPGTGVLGPPEEESNESNGITLPAKGKTDKLLIISLRSMLN
jgi:hypothetical protein